MITIGICTVNYGVFIEMLKHAQILEVDLLISTNNEYFLVGFFFKVLLFFLKIQEKFTNMIPEHSVSMKNAFLNFLT